jgi:hypothetical protein
MIHSREKQRGLLVNTGHELLRVFLIAVEGATALLSVAAIRYLTSFLFRLFSSHDDGLTSGFVLRTVSIVFDMFIAVVLLSVCIRIVRVAVVPFTNQLQIRSILGEPTKVEAWISKQRRENRTIVSLPPNVDVSALGDALPNDDPDVAINVLDIPSSSREKR